MSFKLGKVKCPECGKDVYLTSRVMDGVGNKIQPIIPSHYKCAASGMDYGSPIEKEKKVEAA